MHGCCGTDVGPGLLGTPHAAQNGKKVYIRTSNKCFCNDKETLNMFHYVECLNVSPTTDLINPFLNVGMPCAVSSLGSQSL